MRVWGEANYNPVVGKDLKPAPTKVGGKVSGEIILISPSGLEILVPPGEENRNRMACLFSKLIPPPGG